MSDLIDREKAIDAISKLPVKIDNLGYTWMIAIDVLKQIDDIPSVEPEWKKGQWIIRYFDMETYKYKEKAYNYYEKMPEGDVYCSECKESALLNGHEESVFSNFCPYCGAEMRMRGE